jgi:hypothetical protein
MNPAVLVGLAERDHTFAAGIRNFSRLAEIRAMLSQEPERRLR